MTTENVTPNETEVTEPTSLADKLAQELGAVDEPPLEAIDGPVAEAVAEEAEPEEAPEEDAPAEPEAKAEEQAEDEVGKELKDLGITNEKSRTRFRELAERAKEAETLRDVVQKSDQVFQYMEANGVTGEQFGQAVALIGLINSQEPTKLRDAYNVLTAELQQIAKRIGIEAPGYDPLSEFPEVAQRVKTGELDRKDALELARLTREREAYASRAQSDAAVQREVQEAARVRDELNELGDFLKKTDPLYDQKVAALLPTLKPVLEQLPYAQRANAFKQAYAAFQLPAQPVAVKQVRPAPDNVGRPKAGAGAAVPTNRADYIMQSMGFTSKA